MLTWSEVVPSGGLIRQSKAWCSQCYETWRQTEQPIYEPLLWALQAIEICPIHLKPLTIHCPHCRKTLPFLTQIARPGYCSQCAQWLGRKFISHEGESTCFEIDAFNWQKWISESVGTLLSAAPDIVSKPMKKQIADMMNIYLVGYARGNKSALARLLKMSIPTLWCYLQKTKLPRFDSLLHLCFSLSTSPLEFLTGTTALSQGIFRLTPDPLTTLPHDKRKRITTEDAQLMRQSLELALAKKMDPPTSLKAVAQEIGYSIKTLHRYCTDLCQAIVTQRKQRFNETKGNLRIKQALEEAAISDKRLSLAEVARQINCDCAVLRRCFPELCQIIYKRYRERMKSLEVHQQLLAVLSNEEEAPSIGELARRWGYKRATLEYNFSDLCKQITARHRMLQRREHEERLSITHVQIRQTMLTLHQQGIYPSARQVARRLNNPHLLRRKSEHQIWSKVLEELGYPISGNKNPIIDS